MGAREVFLAGEAPDDVAMFVSESIVDDVERLLEYGERVPGGVLLVVDGDSGRRVFEVATGTDVMTFASQAREREGTIEHDLEGGKCPEAGGEDEEGDHELQFVFAFAEEENQDVGGIYAEGDVLHAYARCSCGTSYADRWVVGE